MRPNKPNTELKISITRIFTNLRTTVSTTFCRHVQGLSYKEESAASARAALLPLMPTETPQIKSHIPTVSPAQNSAKPV